MRRALADDMTRHRSARPSAGKPGFTRGPRIADLMTREYDAFFESSQAAERSGDAAMALEYHRGIPLFARSSHVAILGQLADLADEMTPWLWARWAAYQSTRAEDPGTQSCLITRAALDYTLQMFYDDQMLEAYDEGRDPMEVIKWVVGEDWIYHQLCTFELGGLSEFLDHLAGGRLAEQSAVARSWVGARMGGFRVEQSGTGQLVVRDLATRQQVGLLDLGARVHADPGGHLVGRLVPSGTSPGLMFDTRPLPVDEQTAREAAVSVRGEWITTLARAIGEGRLDRSALQSEDRELVTDVPGLAMLDAGTPAGDRARVLEQLRDGRDEVGRAAYRILRSVADATFGPDGLAPYVAAAAVNPHGYDEARRQLVAAGQQERWGHWAGLVPDPARGRLERLAELSGSRAA